MIEHISPFLKSPLLYSTEPTKAQFMNQLKTEWKEKWALSPRKTRFSNINSEFPLNKFQKIRAFLTRPQCSLVIQLQTNHILLNVYLHKIGKVDSKRCSSCWRVQHKDITETVIHFLFKCPTFDYERHDFDHKLGAQSRNLRTILGNKEHVKELIRYIGRTGRLKKQGEVPPIDLNQ